MEMLLPHSVSHLLLYTYKPASVSISRSVHLHKPRSYTSYKPHFQMSLSMFSIDRIKLLSSRAHADQSKTSFHLNLEPIKPSSANSSHSVSCLNQWIQSNNAIIQMQPCIQQPSRALRFVAGLLEDGLHHFVPKCGGFGEARSEVLRDTLEAVPVGFKVTEFNTVRPCLPQRKYAISMGTGMWSRCTMTYPRSKCKLQVIRAERVIVNRSIQRFVQELRVAEQVFRNTQPKTE